MKKKALFAAICAVFALVLRVSQVFLGGTFRVFFEQFGYYGLIGMNLLFVGGTQVLIALLLFGNRADLGIKPRFSLKIAALALPLSIFVGTAGSYITQIISLIVSGGAAHSPLENIFPGESGEAAAFLLFTVVCAPVYEEITFRFFVLRAAMPHGKAFAAASSGIIFGLCHFNAAQFLYAALMGMVLACVVILTGTIKTSIAVHMACNLLSCLTVLKPEIGGPAVSALAAAGFVILIIYVIRYRKHVKGARAGENGGSGG